MKPVCDKKVYCGPEIDERALYLGQTQLITAPLYRNDEKWNPSGWSNIKDRWNGLCVYTGSKKEQEAFCNTPSSLHSWRTAAQYNPGFVCGVKADVFSATLGAMNGVEAARYDFRVVKASTTSGSYSDIMVAECAKYDMKPVCDKKVYCGPEIDKRALYLGQTQVISAPLYRNDEKWNPSGWSNIKDRWNGLCVYTGSKKKQEAFCNTPSSLHSWRTAAQYNPGFVCGVKVYCESDERALYLGQTQLIS